MRRTLLLTLALLALQLGFSGCVAQKESAAAPPPAAPSGAQLSAEVAEVIGTPEEATVATETTEEIVAPEFEVSEPVDLGSVI